MRGPATALAAVVTFIVVLFAGIVFTATRDREHQSFATVVLSPDTDDPERVSNLLESFERSGTLGTYVELIASDDTTREARDRDVDVTVRAVPDTRTIRLSGVGDEQDVQPALSSVIAATQARQSTLADLFALGVLEQPSEPEQAGPESSLLLIATVLLAGFAALAVALLLRQLASGRPEAGRSQRSGSGRGGPAGDRRPKGRTTSPR